MHVIMLYIITVKQIQITNSLLYYNIMKSYHIIFYQLIL